MAFKKDTKIKNNFTKITIGLASPEEILENSFGEVTKPETINYRTYKPERDGLFCERIFGPTKDYECACGKYKRIRYKGIVCDRCGVEVTEKKVRRERSGHIELVVPIAHIWYFRSLPNKIGYLLGMPTKKLDAVVYYEKYIVIKPGAFEGRTDKDGLEINGSHRMDLLTEDEYLNILDTQLDPNNQLLPDDDPNKFIAKMGAEAIRDLLTDLDLDSISYELRDRANNDSSQQRKTEALKRLQVVEAFRSSKEVNKPEWMIKEDTSRHPPRASSARTPRRWPLCHIRPQRPLPSCHHPQQPSEETRRNQGSRGDSPQREAYAPGGCRLTLRQLSQGQCREEREQSSAQVTLRLTQG